MALFTPFESTKDEPPHYRPGRNQVEILSNEIGSSILSAHHWQGAAQRAYNALPYMYRIDFMDGTTGLYGSDHPCVWLEEFAAQCEAEI